MLITDENFQNEVLDSNVPVLLDFYADWCGPCKMLAPTIDELSKKYEGKAKILKANIDNTPKLNEKFGIKSIPTLILFNKGETIDTLFGLQNEDTLSEKIDNLL